MIRQSARGLAVRSCALQKLERDQLADRALAPFAVPDTQHSLQILPLRELERLARLGAAVLLALDHARVAREETALFQNAAQIRLEIGQRLGDTVTHRARLARQTAAGDGADPV